MKVSLQEVKKIFNFLVMEKASREEVASWALKRQQAEDLDTLEYEPACEEDRIWETISYLTGVDLKDSDGSYLHSIDNFVEFRNEIQI